MENQFNTICDLKVNHTYFDDKSISVFDFVPSEATQKILKKYGFIFIQHTAGFSLAIDKNEDFLDYILNVVGVEYFEIEIITNDPNFYNYTNFPMDQLGDLEYSNLNPDNMDADGSTILTAKFISKSLSRIVGYIRFDLSTIKANYMANQTKFEIQFEARKTQWNYFIVSHKDLGNLDISSKSGFNFKDPVQVKLPSGDMALKFSSGEDFFDLQEKSKMKFNLIRREKMHNGNDVEEILISGLPVANSNKIEIEELNGHRVATSNIYVYI